MNRAVRHLAGQGAWYTLANVLVKLSGFVLLPIYTNAAYLTPDALGRWDVFNVTAQLAVAVLGLQLVASLVRFHPTSDDPEAVLGGTFWITGAMVLLTGGASLLFVELVPAPGSRPLYRLLIAYAAAEMLLAIPVGLLRAQSQAGRYLVLSMFRLALVLGLNLWFLVGLRRGLAGILEAYALASALSLTAAVLMTGPRHYVLRGLTRAAAEPLLRYGLPLVIAGLGSLVLNAGDRYVLKVLSSDEEVALYGVGARFGSVVNMFGVQPLLLAFLPFFLRLGDGERAEVMPRLLRYLAVLFSGIVVGLSTFSLNVIDLMGSEAFYFDAVVLIPWIALGFAAFGLSTLFDAVLQLHRRTGLSSAWMSIAAVGNVLLNLALVPALGPLGAALATFLAYALLFYGRLRAAQQLERYAYRLRSLAAVSLVTTGAALVGAGLSAEVAVSGLVLRWPGGLAGWAAQASLVLAWGGGVVLVGGVDRRELGAGWALLRSFR